MALNRIKGNGKDSEFERLQNDSRFTSSQHCFCVNVLFCILFFKNIVVFIIKVCVYSLIVSDYVSPSSSDQRSVSFP